MALVVAAASSAVVSLPRNNVSYSRSGKSSKSVSCGHHGLTRCGIEARLVGERSSFLSGNLPEFSLYELGGLGSEGGFRIRAQCFRGPQGISGGGRGRVFYMPLGRGARYGGNLGRREWEKRNLAQQEKLREMIEREIMAQQKSEEAAFDYSLLRELEKRLRAEEASRKDDAEDESPARARSGSSTYELMKELEKRLREERESTRGVRESSREGVRSDRDGNLKTGNYATLYEYMTEWDKEMREKRARLEDQWRSWEESKTQRSQGESKPSEEQQNRNRWREGVRQDSASYSRRDSSQRTRTAGREQNVPEKKAAPKHPQTDGTVVYLKNEANGAEIYLVGTSHVSQKSADEVREVIERVRPDFVMVELCRKRYESMFQEKRREKSPMAFVEQVVRMLTNGDIGGVGKLVGVGLASFYRLLSYRGFHPGQEFQVAIEEGKKVGAKIVLGDQDIDTTLKHLGNFDLNMSIQDAFKLFGQRMPDDIAQMVGGQTASTEEMFEKMRDRRVVRRFNDEMEKGAPIISKVLLNERNEAMTKALRNLKGKVVAVVGLAHVDGIEQLWHEANANYFSGLSNQTED